MPEGQASGQRPSGMTGDRIKTDWWANSCCYPSSSIVETIFLILRRRTTLSMSSGRTTRRSQRRFKGISCHALRKCSVIKRGHGLAALANWGGQIRLGPGEPILASNPTLPHQWSHLWGLCPGTPEEAGVSHLPTVAIFSPRAPIPRRGNDPRGGKCARVEDALTQAPTEVPGRCTQGWGHWWEAKN